MKAFRGYLKNTFQRLKIAFSKPYRLDSFFCCCFIGLLVGYAYINATLIFVAFLLMLALLVYLALRRRKSFRFLLLFLVPFFLLILFSCMTGLLDGTRDFRPVVRDGYYLIQVIVYFGVGFLLATHFGSFSKVIYLVFLAGVIVAVLNFARFGWLVVFGKPSFGRIRLVFIDGYPIVLLASFYAFDHLLSKKWKKMLCPLLITFLAVVLTMSRLVLITLIPFLIVDLIHRLGLKRGLLLFSALFIVGASAVCVLFFSGNEFMGEIMRKALTSIEEMNPFQVWTEQTRILYWRGYELFASLSAFSSFRPFNMLFGQGLGYLIPIERVVLGGIVTNAIPITHNAYGAYLCKFGIVGIVLYLLFFSSGIFLKKGQTSLQKALLISMFFEFVIAAVVNQGPISNSVSLPYLLLYGVLVSSLGNKRTFFGIPAPNDLYFEAKV